MSSYQLAGPTRSSTTDANLIDEESLEQLEHVIRGLVEHHQSVANL